MVVVGSGGCGKCIYIYVWESECWMEQGCKLA